MKKKMFSFIVAVIMVVSLSCITKVTGYAASEKIESKRYVVSCSSSSDGKHHMKGRSHCWTKNVNTGETRQGQGGQCRYCHMLIVTQNNLFLNPFQGMGWYSTRSAWADVGNCFIIEVTSFATNSSYTDNVGKQFVWE